MKPPPFRYHDPASVEEVVGLLAERGDDAKVMAGGQSLMPMMSLRLAYPEDVIDINGVPELDYIEPSGESLAIGAMTRHVTLETSAEIAARIPVLGRAMRWVAHTAIRNRGTLGGSLAHADPAAELPAVATALGATVVARSSEGTREIPIEEFFVMPLVSTLAEDELLTEVRIPAQPVDAGSAVTEIARRHGDFAVAGVVAMLRLEGEELRDVRLVSFATGPQPIRLRAAEAELEGSRADERALGGAARAASEGVSPTDDLHATAEYRKRVTGVLVQRAIASGIEDARGRKEDA